MATYYGYVKKDADNYIDWASAANGITDMLETQTKIREEKKQAIDEDFRQNYLELAKNPMGQITTLNQKSLQLAGQSQEIMLKLQKDLKSGKLKLNDYISMKQNIIDSVSGVYNAIKQKNEMSKETFDRMQGKISSPFEYQTFMNIEGMEDLNNMYWNFDSRGMLWMAPKEKKIVDGQEVWSIPDTPMGNYQPIAAVNNGLKFKRDAYKLDERTGAISNMFGKHVDQFVSIQADAFKRGEITKIDDKTAAKDFYAYLDKMIAGEINSDNLNVGDILINNIGVAPNGQAYYIEYDPKKAAQNENAIFTRLVNGKPEAIFEGPNGEAQKKIASQKMRDMILQRFDYERGIQVTNQTEDTRFEQWLKKEKLKEEKLTGASTRKLQQAQTNKVNKETTLLGTESNTPSSPGVGYNTTNYSNYLNSNLTPNLLVKENPAATMANLNNKFSKLGFTFSNATEGTSQRVLVQGLGSATTIIDLDEINENSIPALRAWMEDPSHLNQARVAEQVGKKYD